jgi:hypothetical protein
MPHLPEHAAHDELLISAFVAGDADAGDRARADRLIGECVDCRRLADDLRAIALALPDATVPARPRDFRLDASSARRSRRRLAWSLDSLRRGLRPAGATLATLGIAGLLIAGVSGLGGTTGAIPSTVGNSVSAPAAGQDSAAGGDRDGSGAGLIASPAASAAPSPARPEVAATLVPGATPREVRTGGSTPGGAAGFEVGPIPPPAAPQGPSPLVVGSVGVLAVGLALLVASLLVRRGSSAP